MYKPLALFVKRTCSFGPIGQSVIATIAILRVVRFKPNCSGLSKEHSPTICVHAHHINRKDITSRGLTLIKRPVEIEVTSQRNVINQLSTSTNCS